GRVEAVHEPPGENLRLIRQRGVCQRSFVPSQLSACCVHCRLRGAVSHLWGPICAAVVLFTAKRTVQKCFVIEKLNGMDRRSYFCVLCPLIASKFFVEPFVDS